MTFAETVKRLASWTLTIIDPYGTAPLVGHGGEQGMPLWVAVLLLAVNLAVIVIMILAVVAWLVSRLA